MVVQLAHAFAALERNRSRCGGVRAAAAARFVDELDPQVAQRCGDTRTYLGSAAANAHGAVERAARHLAHQLGRFVGRGAFGAVEQAALRQHRDADGAARVNADDQRRPPGADVPQLQRQQHDVAERDDRQAGCRQLCGVADDNFDFGRCGGNCV